jgi:two-component system CheB/CheR fusion protein
LQQASRGESRGELALCSREGKPVPVLLSVSAVEDGGGRVLCLLATDARASALTAAQRQAQREKQRLEAVMEVLPVGVAITDAAGVNVLSNAAMAQIWRMSRPATGAPDYQSFDAWWAETGKPVLAGEWASTRARETGTAVVGQFLEIGRRDGSRGYVINSGAPIHDPDGALTGSVVAVQDVTDMQRELAARARGARLYAMLSRVNEAIVRCREEQGLHDQVCRILVEVGGYPLAWIGRVKGARVVPAAVAGPAAAYLEGAVVAVDGEFGQGPTGTAIRDGRSVINQDFRDNPVVGPWRERALDHGFRSSASFPLLRGGQVVAALTLYAREAFAFDDEHKHLLEALAADVSYAHDALEHERRRSLAEESLAKSEAALRETAKRRSEFLAVLSHELRNPLAPIKNSLFILDRVAPEGEQANRARAVIERQVDQLARLVDDLLDVTRLTRGKLRMEKARFELVDAVRRTADDYRPSFEHAGLQFETLLAGAPLWIDGDAARLVQVVGNLLANAAKFTPRGGKVTLSVCRECAGTAAIRVRDTGLGIAMDLLPRLFEPFMQADNTLDRSKGGLGLGLALVKGVVEMHGGSVEPKSQGLGQGAEFTVRLPVLDETDDPVPPDGAPTPPLAHRRVLVIEDHPDAAQSLRDVLSLGSHVVEIAGSGPEGIEKARVFNPDVVICDIGLPGMSGYDVAKAFRADPTLHTAVLVALSGYAQPEDLQRAAEAGFEAHLAKPASIERLEEVLLRSRPT